MYGTAWEHEIACEKPCCLCGKGSCPYMGIACNIKEHYCESCSKITPGWCVYILKCSDSTLYTGSTNDLIHRIKQHNDGKGAKYTKYRGPVTLVKFFSVENKSQALKLELKIKKLSREDKIKLCKYT